MKQVLLKSFQAQQYRIGQKRMGKIHLMVGKDGGGCASFLRDLL